MDVTIGSTRLMIEFKLRIPTLLRKKLRLHEEAVEFAKISERKQGLRRQPQLRRQVQGPNGIHEGRWVGES
jgi:transposase InsO family protein